MMLISTVFLTFFQINSSLSLTLEERQELNFIEGLNYLNNSEFEDGIPILENVFRESLNPTLKSKSAYLLAITNYDKRKGVRSNYGKHAYFNHPRLNHRRKIDLAMLVADLFFNEGNIEESIKFYDYVIKDEKADFSIREMAIYKYGWAQVNNGNYEDVFKSWKEWIEKYHVGQLREDIVHDYGKFFFEYGVIGERKDLILNLKFEKGSIEQNALESGMISGLRRYPFQNHSDSLHKILNNISYSNVLEVILHESLYFKRRPCESLSFVNLSDPDVIDNNVVINMTNRCLLKKNKKNKNEILSIYSKFLGDGKSNFIRGKYLLENKIMRLACESFVVGLQTEGLVEISENDLLNSLKGVALSCFGDSFNNEDFLFNQNIYDLFVTLIFSKRFYDLYLKNKKIASVFKLLLKQNYIVFNTYSNFSKKYERWKNTKILAIYLKNLEKYPELFFDFVDINNISLNSGNRRHFVISLYNLIETGSYEKAYSILKNIFPLKSASFEISKLWLLLSQGEFSKEIDFPSFEQISKKFEDGFRNIKELSENDKKFYIYFLLKNKDFQQLFFHWTKLKHGLLKSSDILEVFFEEITYGNVSIPRNLDDDFVDFICDLRDVFKNNSVRKKLRVPIYLRKTSFYQDLKTLNFTLSIFYNQTHFSKKSSEDFIMKSLKNFTYIVNIWQKKSWFSSKTYQKSRDFLKDSFVVFKKNLLFIHSDMKLGKDKLDKIIEIVKTWEGVI